MRLSDQLKADKKGERFEWVQLIREIVLILNRLRTRAK